MRAARPQRGFALLIMLIVVVMGSLFAVTSQLEFVSRKYLRDEGTAKSLAQAKEALVGYAVTYRDSNSNEVFGYLPCPDIASGDGTAAASCGSANQAAVGLFPYKSLGLPDLRDSDGGCLWYAVSGPAKNNPKATTTVMNWDTQGQFSLVGTSIAPEQGDGGAVAVIFAAGIPLSGQSRSVFGAQPPLPPNPVCQIDPTQAAAFLDGNYNFATSSAIAITPGASGSASNNDQLAWISPKDIFDKVVRRTDFANPLTSTPVGQINKLGDEIKALLETKIQNDVVAGTTSNSQPANTGSYTQSAGKQVGDLQSGLSLSTAYASYYSNWSQQYRQVTCSPLTTCLTIAGTACRGALMFGGRSSTANGYSANGQPRLTAHKTSSTANLNYFFESASGREILNSSATAFLGNTAYAKASPSADVGICLLPGVIESFAQDIASFTRIVTSALIPEAVIDTVAKTITLGNPAAVVAGRGCVWFPTQLSFNSMLRAYFRMSIANLGEGFIFAVVDGINNQAAVTANTICGTTTGAYMGYSSANLAAPKFGWEIDTRLNTIADCVGSDRNDPSSHHTALVYWGSTSTSGDDNCHGATAGTLGSGSQPLNPRTLSTSSTTPATTVATLNAASWSGNVATVTTVAAHGQSSNQQVTISGVSPTGYNGTYPIAVIDATHFAYSVASDPGTYSSGGTVKINAGIKNLQASDTSLPMAGTVTLNTDVHVRLDVAKAYDATRVQGASWTANTVILTTATAHGRLSNQRVTLSGVSPAAYNGTYTITVADSTHFTYALGADPGSYVSGGLIRPPTGLTVSAASRAASGAAGAYVASITTSAAHGFVSGQPVTIASVSPAAYNGTYQIVVVDATHFTYALGADPGAYASGGTLTAAVALSFKAYTNSTFPSCTLTDFQNLAGDLSDLCLQNPTLQQDNVYMNDTASGKALATVFTGFTNAQGSGSTSEQTITVSNFIIRTQ